MKKIILNFICILSFCIVAYSSNDSNSDGKYSTSYKHTISNNTATIEMDGKGLNDSFIGELARDIWKICDNDHNVNKIIINVHSECPDKYGKYISNKQSIILDNSWIQKYEVRKYAISEFRFSPGIEDLTIEFYTRKLICGY
ncbi:hypothetical protein [Empedobacter falsenii]|nr:hypothetical protein [Flavobacteriaceae bacterium]